MKKIYTLLLVLIFCCTGISFAHVVPKKLNPAEKLCVYAEEIENKKDVCFLAIGEATKKLNADSAVIFAYFESESEQLSSNTNLQYDTMVENLYEKGVMDGEIFLSHFSSYPQYDESGIKKFVNCYNFNIMVKDLQKMNNILSVLEFCKADVMDIKYQVSNINEEYTKVLNDAIEDAKYKAGEFYGKELTLVDIKEKSVLYSSTLSESDLDNAQVTIEIHAKVEAVFE